MVEDSRERKKRINRLIKNSIKFSNEIAKLGDPYDAGDFLYSAAESLEELGYEFAVELYEHNIKLWNRLIENYVMQAKLHEIAEIYLRIADIYKEKLSDQKAQKDNVLKSIEYLTQEINLIQDFSENGNVDTRKLAQNYQNVAELYVKIGDYKNAILFYEGVVEFAKVYNYIDLISFSYQQIASCHEELDEYNQSNNVILDAIDYFSDLYQDFEEKGDCLALAQVSQILKNLYKRIDNQDQFIIYSKKESSAYIDLAESLEKKEEEFQKIARYYRGAGLCYLDINNNLIESASCFILAGNYSEKIEDYPEAAMNFIDAANVFKELSNYEMAYKHLIKAGDNFWKIEDYIQATECYLNAYDIVIEGELEFNRFGIFNQIVQ
ncbi:MAG: hypothetical protein EU539_11515, partial [Promethearchaeota archaeon]